MEKMQTFVPVFVGACLSVALMHGSDQGPAAYRHCGGKVRLVRLKSLPEETNNWIKELETEQQRVSCDIKRAIFGGFIFRAKAKDELDIGYEKQELKRMLEHN